MKGFKRAMVAVLLFGLVLALPRPGCATGYAPPVFVDVTHVVPGVHLDIRYFTSHNFVGARVDGYRAPKCLLTRHAAEALRGVQKDLQPFGLSLKIYDCYRPQSAVNHFVRWAKDVNDAKTKKEFYPDIDKRNLFRDGYIAEKSGHSRGSTVDLTIIVAGGPEQETYTPGQPLFECYLPADKRFRDNSIDMGTGFDCFSEVSHTVYGGIGAGQRINRLLLKALMEKHGFVNYDKEWWHYTLKDEPFPDTYFDFAVE
jgi:D-alanyl-D-alanine dipeptidase